jgi:hypothetical protein
VGDNPALGYYPGSKLAAYSDPLGHNIPQAMWDFLNLKGTVRRDRVDIQDQTLANWVYVMGYPITEPYWARVKIGGIYQDALFQLYERRSLAYVPAMPKGWQVQMGNVGQHYYTWVYGGPLPTPLVPLARPSQPSANVPPAIDATIEPLSAPVGTPFSVAINGFRSGEDIVSWFTAPGGAAMDARFNLVAGKDGTVRGLSVSTIGMAPGVWAVTYHGKQSNHESIAYFQLTPRPGATTPTARATPRSPTRTPIPRPTRAASPSPSPTFPLVPTQPATGLMMSVRPGYGPPDGQFTFTASGLAAGESVQVKFTDPTGNVTYPRGSNDGQYLAGADGVLRFTLQPTQDFPAAPSGSWLWELRGLQSGLEGVVGFTLR